MSSSLYTRIQNYFPAIPKEIISRTKNPQQLVRYIEEMIRNRVEPDQAEKNVLTYIENENKGLIKKTVQTTRTEFYDYVCNLPDQVYNYTLKNNLSSTDVLDTEVLLMKFYLNRLCTYYKNFNTDNQRFRNKVLEYMNQINVPVANRTWFYPFFLYELPKMSEEKINFVKKELSNPCGQSLVKSAFNQFDQTLKNILKDIEPSQRNFSNKDLLDLIVNLINGTGILLTEGYSVAFKENFIFDQQGNAMDVISNETRFDICKNYLSQFRRAEIKKSEMRTENLINQFNSVINR